MLYRQTNKTHSLHNVFLRYQSGGVGLNSTVVLLAGSIGPSNMAFSGRENLMFISWLTVKWCLWLVSLFFSFLRNPANFIFIIRRPKT
jgi:hypothetical protein